MAAEYGLGVKLVDLHEVRSQGVAAKATHGYLKPVIDAMRQSYLDQITASDLEDKALREECYRRICTLDAISETFIKVISAGGMADAELIRETQIQKGEIKEFF